MKYVYFFMVLLAISSCQRVPEGEKFTETVSAKEIVIAFKWQNKVDTISGNWEHLALGKSGILYETKQGVNNFWWPKDTVAKNVAYFAVIK